TTLIQALVDVLGQRQQAATQRGGLGCGTGLEHDAVVLVGVQRLLAAAFATETQPAKGHAGVAKFLDAQFDDPAYGVVVEQGDQLGDLRGARAVGQHALDQQANVFAPGNQ